MTYDGLVQHIGHDIECVEHKDGLSSTYDKVIITCLDCNVTLVRIVRGQA